MRNLNTTRAELQEAWQRVRQRWQGTIALWNDPVKIVEEGEQCEKLKSEITW